MHCLVAAIGFLVFFALMVRSLYQQHERAERYKHMASELQTRIVTLTSRVEQAEAVARSLQVRLEKVGRIATGGSDV